ncbi:MAG: hypothetical protein QF464_17560, partial [Myxococcota bacterium]|nr:hypothetical protein [Myxococcota bacterium]
MIRAAVLVVALVSAACRPEPGTAPTNASAVTTPATAVNTARHPQLSHGDAGETPKRTDTPATVAPMGALPAIQRAPLPEEP